MANRQWLGTDTPHIRRRKIEQLDPERDAREIVLLFYRDFQSLQLLPAFIGYMVSNAAPRQSRILAASGELEHRVAKRFVDTAVLGFTIMEHGVAKPGDGRVAARRVNAMHTNSNIHPEDMVAFSCAQVVSAIQVAESFGWRRVTNIEREALRVHYTEATRIFGGRAPFPATLPEIYAFWDRYLDEQLAFEPQNLRLATKMLDFLSSLLPGPLRPFAKELLLAQVDERIVSNTGLKLPGSKMRRLSDAVFRGIGMLDPLPDDAPDFFSMIVRKVYPDGYSLEKMGTKHGAKDDLGFDDDSPAEKKGRVSGRPTA